jgi:hypothetical protein
MAAAQMGAAPKRRKPNTEGSSLAAQAVLKHLAIVFGPVALTAGVCLFMVFRIFTVSRLNKGT